MTTKEKIAEKNKRYRLKNAEKIKAYLKKYNEENPGKRSAATKRWKDANPEMVKDGHKKYQWWLKRYKTPLHKLANSSRRGVRRGIQGKRCATQVYLGCSFQELSEHLESKFQDGMTWDNYGFYGWHIDHVTPLSSAKSMEDLIPLLHFSNLQPLWAKDNLVKGDKLPPTP